jgi:hypothetical protein
VERIPRHINEEFFSDPLKNGPFGVEFSQIPIGLWLWHLERLSPFPQQPLNGLELSFCLFPLCKQHTDGKRRKHQRTHQIFSPLRTFPDEGFLAAGRERHESHLNTSTFGRQSHPFLPRSKADD